MADGGELSTDARALEAAAGVSLEAVITPFARMEGGLLPLLHAVQAAFGHVDDGFVPVIAGRLNLSRAEVHGVLTFYHDFRRRPAGRLVVRLCRGEACQSMGADALIAHAEARLGTGMQATRADGAVTLEPVFCLGLCSAAPSGMIDGAVVGRLTPARLDQLIGGMAR